MNFYLMTSRASRLIPFLPVALATALSSCSPAGSSKSAAVPADGAKLTVLDAGYTTGALCTEQDPNFDGLRYPEQIPHCARNVSMAEKLEVAQHYGIATAEFSQYEFDHFIPLAVGGSNAVENLWPQRLDQAKKKDGLEVKLYNELVQGSVTQAEALSQIKAWAP